MVTDAKFMRPAEVDLLIGDATKARTKLGWKPTVTFPQLVATMVDNIQHWADAPIWTPASIQNATRAWFEVLSR